MLEIECKWVKIPKSKMAYDDGERKCGRYTSCFTPIENFGVSNWVVAGYVEVEYQKYLDEGYSYDEIVEGCANFLSMPPPKVKYQKKAKPPKYGVLTPLLSSWSEYGKYSVKPKKGFDNRLIVEFITNERKNKNFWSEGINYISTTKPSKRGRKKKEK